jgi:hypothetical protein
LDRITAQRQIYVYQGFALAALLVALLIIWLTSYGSGGNPPAPAPTAFGQWVTYGSGTGAGAALFHQVNGLWQFTFPTQASGSTANYAYTKAPGPLKAGQTFTINYSIDGNATFQPLPESGCGTQGCGPANFRFFFWEAGDNLSGQGQYAYYRWFCNAHATTLKIGDNQTMSCVVQPSSDWGSVYGASGDQAVAGYNQAMANVQWVGFTFGGQFAGHGVWTTSGNATFTINNISIK